MTKPDLHLEIIELTKDFGGHRAVNELSFGIGRQEIVGLIGPNGSGKTTTINLIAGAHKPTSGRVLFKGRPIQGLPPWKISKLGIARTFQINRSFPVQTVLENVVLGCHVVEKTGILDSILFRRRVNAEKKSSEEKAMKILQSMGMDSYAMRPVSSLSPGLQRTLAIAICLAGDPEILFLDEPACGLSAEESGRLMDRVRQLSDQGLSILMIDHNMRMIMKVCERLVVIDHGTKLAEGTPQEIASNNQVIEAYLGHRKVA